ncbi:MAG: hypothetical protein H0V71_07165 [Chloroflexi bacterium]|nr:hypothetical protein [Chloroflexota bacterium]
MVRPCEALCSSSPRSPSPHARRPLASWALVDQIRAANALVRGYAAADPRLLYVDVFSPMLRPDGGPREDLFVADRLHLNARGYALWRELLLPIVGHSARSLALVSS